MVGADARNVSYTPNLTGKKRTISNNVDQNLYIVEGFIESFSTEEKCESE